jgi:hypothetical protein
VLQVIRNWRWPVCIGVVGWLAVAATRTDPGITSDEPFSVIYGIDFVSRLCDRGLGFFSPQSINETFADRNEHPPLGRWLIGGCHRLVAGRMTMPAPGIQDILDSRFAPATAFALMLVILTRVVTIRMGGVAGVASGVSLLLMPRVFADAHFAALETFVSLTYLVGLLTASWMMDFRRAWLVAPVAGIFLGLAFLTKIHGFLLPPLVGLWALTYFRFRSLIPCTIWVVTGVVVFFAGWPWLWNDLRELWAGICGAGFDGQPMLARLSAYLGSSVDRAAIYVSYPGGPYRDSEVPWHYPWVMFAVTVPVGIHLLAICGIAQFARNRGDSKSGLYLGAVLFPLVVFSIPRVPVYDGVRLFSMVFPFWAAIAGQGAVCVFEKLRHVWGSRVAYIALVLFLGCQSFGVIYYHPFQLSYYNLLVGGLRGAERLQFEVTYWGDSVTTDLLDRWSTSAAERSCGVLVPTLYAEQAELYQTSGMLRRRQRLTGHLSSKCPYLIVYNRRAYLNNVRAIIDDPAQKPIHETAVDSIWIARVYQRPLPVETQKEE